MGEEALSTYRLGQVRVDPTAEVGPRVVLDGRSGPVDVGHGAVLGPGCTLVGPVRVEAGAHLVADVVLSGGVVVGREARVAARVVAEGPVRIGARCRLEPGATILGDTTLADEVVVGSHAVLGGGPQIRGDEGGSLLVGPGTVLREGVTVHRGSAAGAGRTLIGSGCLVMAGVHVGHDAIIESGATIAGGAQLAGHVEIGEGVVLGGLCGLHQFVRVGRLAMVAAGAMVSRDVPPFHLVAGDRARLVGLNGTGLRRAGWTPARVAALKRGLRVGGGEGSEASAELREVAAFASGSRRGVMRR